MARRLGWLALATLSAYAIFIGGSWFGIYQPVLRLISVVIAAVVLAAWVVLARRDPSWRPGSALMPAIVACISSLAVSTAFSRAPGVSLEYLAYAVLLAALYLLLVQLLRRGFFRKRFITLTGALFTTIVGVYLVLTFSHWIAWLGELGRITVPPLRPEFESLTFGNPSTVLTLVALLAVPLVASVSWTSRRGVSVAILVLALTGAVALISGSRAGWLALAVAGTVAVLAGLLVPESRAALGSLISRRLSTTGGRVLIGLVVVVGAAVVVGLAPAIIRRASEGGEANRLTFVRIALELFAQSPIVGTGLGTWVIERPALTRVDEIDEYIPHAHNIYAQTLGELGVIGAVAGVVLVLLLARLVIGAIRSEDRVRRRLGWATLVGLVYFGAHQLLDFYANFPSVLFAAAIPVALLDAGATHGSGKPARFASLGAAPLVAGALVVAVALGGLGWQELPALDANRAVDLANTGNWAAADAPARAATARDPRVASYGFTAGLTAAHSGDHAAAASYFQAVTAGNDLPEAWLNLAAEQAELGDRGGAVDSVRAALRIGRQRPGVAIPAGDLAMRIGQNAIAVEAMVAAVLTSPSFLGDQWWTQDDGRVALRDQVANAAMAAGSTFVRWEIALMSGDVNAARTLAADPALDPSPTDFVNAWAGDEAAYGRVIERCRNEPLRLQPLFWCARIEGHRGDIDAANRYRHLANAQIGGAYRNGAELRIATTPMVGRSLEGNPAIFWGTYTYRRPTPWDVLVPSLAHLTLQ